MTDTSLTDAEDRPLEPRPRHRSSLGAWAILAGGPAVWMTQFMVVYLLAEASCAGLATDEWSFIGQDALVWATVVATVVAALICAAVAVAARRRMRGRSRDTIDLATVGFLLAIGSLAGVIAVGAPALYLDPVC